MRNILIVFISAILFSCNSKTKAENKEINVLFIGNSLTYYNDMPQMLQEMMNEKKTGINIEQVTFPGFSLTTHLDNIIQQSSKDHVSTRRKTEGELTETEKKLREKEWDIIVLQTGGVRILIPEVRRNEVDLAIKRIKELSSPDTEFYLFNTWTTEIEYPKEFCYPASAIDPDSKPGEKFCSPQMKNREEYFDLLQTGYRELSDSNQLNLTTHARVFKKVWEEQPEIELLEDSMHPSREGAFLSACIFYKLLSGNDPEELDYSAGLSSSIAETLKREAS